VPGLLRSTELDLVGLPTGGDGDLGDREELPEDRLVREERHARDGAVGDRGQSDLLPEVRVVLDDDPLVGHADEAGARADRVVDGDDLLALLQALADQLQLPRLVEDDLLLGHDDPPS
jgi:hypothetical protein